ncbi:MAG: methyltransferase domain-containing protein [Alphaproteobacteria bacterium]|nr:methyltransferase domain-containing protein [Alphaproteobacteria bacterium]
MTLFDANAYALHQKRSQKKFSNHAFLFEHVGNELISRLRDLKKTFKKPLKVSPHPLPYPGHHHASLDQPLPFETESFDLILNCLQGHWVNDLPAYLKNIYASLQNEGLFLGALWGGRTLVELRESLMQAELALTGGASPRVAPMLHPADAPTLLDRTGFFMPVVDTDIITVSYPSLRSLMKDLRGMGETNKLNDRPKTFTSQALFEKAEAIYREIFPQPNQTISATFEVIFLTGWKVKRPPIRQMEGRLEKDS